MELLYNREDVAKVKKERNIDIEAIKNFFIRYEDVYTFLKNTEDIEQLLDGLERRFPAYNLSRLNKLKLENSIYYNSLLYYYNATHKMVRGFSENRDFNKCKSIILKLIATVENAIMYEVEQSYLTSEENHNLLLLFEACPSDLKEIKTRYEAVKIKTALKNHSFYYYPIIRFGTNAHIFKNTCKLYEGRISIIHFACHGDKNGSLCLLGNDGTSNLLLPKTFENFFVNEYKIRGSLFKLLFLNSCYSYNFVSSIYKNIQFIFPSIISYRDENDDDYASEFSVAFYKKHLSDFSQQLCEVYEKIIEKFELIDVGHSHYADGVMWNVL